MQLRDIWFLKAASSRNTDTELETKIILRLSAVAAVKLVRF